MICWKIEWPSTTSSMYDIYIYLFLCIYIYIYTNICLYIYIYHILLFIIRIEYIWYTLIPLMVFNWSHLSHLRWVSGMGQTWSMCLDLHRGHQGSKALQQNTKTKMRDAWINPTYSNIFHYLGVYSTIFISIFQHIPTYSHIFRHISF